MAHRLRLRSLRQRGLIALLVPSVALAAMAALVVSGPAHAAASLLSQGKPTTASSTENAGTPAAAATDGNTGTRWSSANSDPQWLQVDLGATATINQVVLNWEAAYGTAFQVQTSTDAVTWTSVYSTTTGTGGVQTLTVSGSGRYVRMYGTVRATGYGYSLWEFQVYGTSGATTTPSTTPTTTPSTCGATNVAQGKTATASSVLGGNTAALAVDGNAGTRWESAASDPQWLQVDLGTSTAICRVVVNWETAAAKAFTLQTSADGTTWTQIYSTTTSTGGVQTLAVAGTGRFLRMNGTVRTTQYGYSLWELQIFAGGTSTATVPPGCGTANLAQGRPTTASSTENAGTGASLATDGNAATRWASAFTDAQWIQVDLGVSQPVCKVVLNWEAAYGKSYQIQTSPDGVTWSTIASTTTGAGGIESINATGSGRYVRMNGILRATGFGYSLWEMQVYATGVTTTPTPTTTPTSPGTWGGFPAAFWGNTAAIPAANNVMELQILNRTNGQYPDSQAYYSFNGQMVNVATNPYFDMPVNSSGRMYFYLGSPNNAYQDFIEFTIGAAQFNGNTTRVDAWALPIVMHLHNKDGSDQTVGDSYQVFNETRDATFTRFVAAMPAEFKALAQAPYYPTRIISPGSLPAFQPGGVNQNYMSAYAAANGITATTQEIFGCSGTIMAAQAQTCANANRHVLGTATAVQNDPAQYYKSAPANYYAKFWHDNGVDALAYGFPYDDVNGQSSFVVHDNPQYLQVAVGW